MEKRGWARDSVEEQKNIYLGLNCCRHVSWLPSSRNCSSLGNFALHILARLSETTRSHSGLWGSLVIKHQEVFILVATSRSSHIVLQRSQQCNGTNIFFGRHKAFSLCFCVLMTMIVMTQLEWEMAQHKSILATILCNKNCKRRQACLG